MRWFLVDATNLILRHFHARRHSLAGPELTAAILSGVSRDLSGAADRHGPGTPAFFFDTRPYKRTDLYAPYKEKVLSNKTNTTLLRTLAAGEVAFVRDTFLPSQHYENVFWKVGYEADDLIASAAARLPGAGDTAVIVSTDQDFWQLLGPGVVCHDPKVGIAVAQEDFEKAYKIPPRAWVTVKAIAGCKSDNVAGVRGVGEGTALKFLHGSLRKRAATFKKIAHFVDSPYFKINLDLVRLPFTGTPAVHMTPAPRPSWAWDWARAVEDVDARNYAPGGTFSDTPKRRR